MGSETFKEFKFYVNFGEKFKKFKEFANFFKKIY